MCGFIFGVFAFLLLGSSPSLGGWQEDLKPKVTDREPVEGSVRFNGNGSYTDFFRLFVRDGKNVLVGARNAVYNLTSTGLKLNSKLEWYSDEHDISMCLTKGKDPVRCENYIRILSVTGDGSVFVCGTNAYKPRCRNYTLKVSTYGQNGDEKSGQGICPYDPDHNSTSIVLKNGDVFAGTVADFAEVDPLIHRWGSLRTMQYDLNSLNAPNFVGSMVNDDFVFFFFRETAEEMKNCGKTVLSRVGRVCAGDRGTGRKNKWTSFFKATLNCSVPGDFPFSFNEIQSLSGIIPSSNEGSKVIYGVFRTGSNSIGGSAVCAFTLRDILDVFDGKFKGQETPTSHWLPLSPEKVPEPRPGVCQNDSTTLPDEYYHFVQNHVLMDENVGSVGGTPIITLTRQSLTAIAVHNNVSALDGTQTDVIFVGTQEGKILTFVRTGGASVFVSEVRVFPPRVPVRQLLLLTDSHPRLLASSDDTLTLINVRECRTAKLNSCAACVGLRSPYCGWHKREEKCLPIPGAGKKEYLQAVGSGLHSECPQLPIKTTKSTETFSPVPQQNMDMEEGLPLGGNETYTGETLSIAVGIGCLLAILLGFIGGFFCGRRWRKDEDNIPYPDTDYSYFEQRQNLNLNSRLMEGKEEATYAEPVLDGKPLATSMAPMQETNLFHFQQPHYPREPYSRFDGEMSRGRVGESFGTLRSQEARRGLDSYDAYGTAGRSVKKVYL